MLNRRFKKSRCRMPLDLQFFAEPAGGGGAGNGAADPAGQPQGQNGQQGNPPPAGQQNPAAGSAEPEKQPVYGQPASGQSAVEGSPASDQNSDAAQNRQEQASDSGMQEQTPETQKEQEQPWRPPCQPQPENRGVFSQAPEPRDDHKH